MESTLWISKVRRQEVLKGNRAFPDILTKLRPEPSNGWPDSAMQTAVEAFLNQDPDLGLAAPGLCHEGIASAPAGWEDLGKAHAAMACAVVYDATNSFWDVKTLQRWQADTSHLLRSFYEISGGNPHAIGNNWWAVTHSGLYFCVVSLRTSGLDAVPGLRPLAEIEAWAWKRLEAFLGHFGEGGAYHEGLGYQDYTCSFLLPACLLREARCGDRLERQFPGLKNMAAFLLCSGIEGARLDDTTGLRDGWGRQLSWNDAGLGWSRSAVTRMAIHWAKPKASLLKQWKRLVDPDGCDLPRRHAFGATFFEMVTDSGSNLDEEDLPRSVFDRKQGLWFSRNAYAGPQDAVLGAFARCYHPGGHSQADAGSFRFSALGWDWVIGGGQARPEARWQSVVTTSDPAEKPRCGGVLWEENCVFGMELRSVHQSYSERYLAFRAGGPVAVAVLDLIDDHRNDRDWFWNLTFSPEMSWTFREFGFELLAPDGALMRVAFLGTPFLEMDVVWSPESERTYANGKTLSYISRPAVQVKFPRVKSLNIYALITVHGPGESMPLVSLGEGLDVKWGAQAWERPFGMVFPRDLTPGTIRGQCRFPS